MFCIAICLVSHLRRLPPTLCNREILHRTKYAAQQGDSWKFYQYVGYFLIIAAFIFHIMVVFVSQHDDNIGVAYPFLVYLIALATFINFISSMIQLFRLRRSSSAYLKASKNISFASSFFFLQTMMLRQFSGPADAYFSWLITIILGTCVFNPPHFRNHHDYLR